MPGVKAAHLSWQQTHQDSLYRAVHLDIKCGTTCITIISHG